MLKPFLTIDDQVDRLRVDHGLFIEDVQTAKLYLEKRSYYRLNYYFKKFLDKNDQFGDQISFQDTVNVEETDSKLRHIFFRYIEYIELKLRTQFGYRTAEAFQADALYNQQCFTTKRNKNGFAICQACIHEILNTRRDDLAIKHHINNYAGILPSWVVVEFLSLGSLSLLLNYLKSSIRDRIINSFRNANNSQISKKEFLSWVHAVSVFRNTCAHHGALFRFKLRVSPGKWRDQSMWSIPNDSVFAIVYCIYQLLENEERREFLCDLNQIAKEIQNQKGTKYLLRLDDYGFPINWQNVLN